MGIIRANGLVKPLCVRFETREVLDGNQRLDVVTHDLNIPKIPVTYVKGLDDAQARALNIALVNEDAQGDVMFGALCETVIAADGMGVDPEAMGFDDESLAEMMTWTPDPEDDGDDIPDGGSLFVTCPSCGERFEA